MRVSHQRRLLEHLSVQFSHIFCGAAAKRISELSRKLSTNAKFALVAVAHKRVFLLIYVWEPHISENDRASPAPEGDPIFRGRRAPPEHHEGGAGTARHPLRDQPS